MAMKVEEKAAAAEFPVVKKVEAIKILVMKRKHYEQLPIISREIIDAEHGILGLVDSDRPGSVDGWLVIELEGRLVRCSMLRYIEAKLRADESVPFEDRDQYYRTASAILVKSIPQLFID